MVQGDNQKPHLMVVDDEVDNLALLYRTFRRDFQVHKAESAREALEILDREGEMAVIISDQRMPGMSGIEFLGQTLERFPDTIRMVLTGYTDVHDLVDAINNGKVFKYITKPWDARDLLPIVQQAAETYRAVKQRTSELNRALRRESMFNAVMTAIRESLDYDSMLQTVVETMGRTFAADACIVYPLELVSSHASSDLTQSDSPLPFVDAHAYWSESVLGIEALQAEMMIPPQAVLESVGDRQFRQVQYLSGDQSYHHLILPLVTQQQPLAVISLYKSTDAGWRPEDIEVLESVSEQVALAIAQARLYQQVQSQKEQMRAELEVARQIQSNLLRQRLPKLDTARIQACCHPAREVGGDFFEVFQHPQGDVWLAVGDVSGKGVPAALFMASAISVLRRELSQEKPPEPNIILQNLNRSLLDDLVRTNCFITMVLAQYTPATQQLTYANAGHLYPLVWHHPSVIAQAQEGSIGPRYLKTRGVPIGILPEWMAKSEQISLQTGEVFLLTSDGITEAVMNTSDPENNNPSQGRAMLHQSGLWQLVVRQGETLDLAQILADIQAQNPVQEDDQTILSLEVL